MSKIDWASFVSNIIAVILGIFITFGIQGLIDRRSEKKDVASALELVKDELISNVNSLQDVIGIIVEERLSAELIRANLSDLSKVDQDSLLNSNAVICTEYFFTVTDDALELLKTSSLFQKINDRNLALGIIRAYDFLNANSQAFNMHEKLKISLCEEANTEEVKKASLNSSGMDYLKSFYGSDKAGYLLKSVVDMSDESFLKSGLSEIEATINAIGSRVK